MSRIPFDIKYKPQIESGEYKVETRDGRPVRVLCWDRAAKGDQPKDLKLCVLVQEDNGEAVYYYRTDGTKWVKNVNYDLFIVTPEEELSEFEERIFKLLRQYKECDIPLTPENIKAEASMLWQDFEKYFFYLYGKEGEGDSALRSFYYRGLADGKAEALKDLPRWKTIEDATVKRTDDNDCVTTETMLVSWGNRNDYGIVGPECMVNRKTLCIPVIELSKLPGFKEE